MAGPWTGQEDAEQRIRLSLRAEGLATNMQLIDHQDQHHLKLVRNTESQPSPESEPATQETDVCEALIFTTLWGEEGKGQILSMSNRKKERGRGIPEGCRVQSLEVWKKSKRDANKTGYWIMIPGPAVWCFQLSVNTWGSQVLMMLTKGSEAWLKKRKCLQRNACSPVDGFLPQRPWCTQRRAIPLVFTSPRGWVGS